MTKIRAVEAKRSAGHKTGYAYIRKQLNCLLIKHVIHIESKLVIARDVSVAYGIYHGVNIYLSLSLLINPVYHALCDSIGVYRQAGKQGNG